MELLWPAPLAASNSAAAATATPSSPEIVIARRRWWWCGSSGCGRPWIDWQTEGSAEATPFSGAIREDVLGGGAIVALSFGTEEGLQRLAIPV
jgi:hypothetical protein